MAGIRQLGLTDGQVIAAVMR